MLLYVSKKSNEIERRTAAARAAIQSAVGDKLSVGFFIFHHLNELGATYWKEKTGKSKPTPRQVVDLLVLRSHWGGDAEMDRLDFTLPSGVTDYVISVRFDEAGKVEGLEMES